MSTASSGKADHASAGFVRRRLERLRRVLTRAPRAKDWGELVVTAVLLYGVFGALGFLTGLLTWAPRPPVAIAGIAATALVVPAFGEEVLFRALMISDRASPSGAPVSVIVSTLLFTLWHGLETLWLPAMAPIFLRLDFLGWAAALGLACAALYRRSGSLWPPVLLHWGAVLAWQGWLGGPVGFAGHG